MRFPGEKTPAEQAGNKREGGRGKKKKKKKVVGGWGAKGAA